MARSAPQACWCRASFRRHRPSHLTARQLRSWRRCSRAARSSCGRCRLPCHPRPPLRVPSRRTWVSIPSRHLFGTRGSTDFRTKKITASVVAVNFRVHVFAVGAMTKMLKGKGERSRNDVPDLHTQWESLLDQVWQSEADWRLWDRVDAVVRLETLREQRGRQEGPQA